jgi:hypothetical protein
MRVFSDEPPRDDLVNLPLLTKAARAVKTERWPPTACLPLRQRADRSLIPPWSAAGNEIANSGGSKPKGPNMTERKTNRPTHRVYAVRKTGPETSYWAEIGAAWTNRDGQGFNMKLTLLPVGEADIVVREIRDEEGGVQ